MKKKCMITAIVTGLVLGITATVPTASNISVRARAATVKYTEQKKQFNSQNASFNYDGVRIVKAIYDVKDNNEKIYVSTSLKRKGNKIYYFNKTGIHAYDCKTKKDRVLNRHYKRKC